MGVCDVCNADIGPSARRVSAAEFRIAVTNGLRPGGSARALADAFNLPLDSWVPMAMASSTDWALCDNCAVEFDRYRHDRTARGVARPPASSWPSVAAIPAPVPLSAATESVPLRFVLRAVALILDSLVIGLPALVGLAAIGLVGQAVSRDAQGALGVLFLLLFAPATLLYFAVFESSRLRATLGKRVVGLAVTDLDGGRISLARAFGRLFGKFVSGMPCYLGYLLAAFTEKGQALHDMLASTLVVRRTLLVQDEATTPRAEPVAADSLLPTRSRVPTASVCKAYRSGRCVSPRTAEDSGPCSWNPADWERCGVVAEVKRYYGSW